MIDQSVRDYIDALKGKYYLDASTQKNGASLLGEMIALTKLFVEIRKRQAEKQRDFLAKRLSRVISIQSEVETLSNNYGLVDKYDIFWNHSQDLVGDSNYMDETVAKISHTVANSVRKVRTYKREYGEIQYKIANIEELLEFYESAETELSDLEAEL